MSLALTIALAGLAMPSKTAAAPGYAVVDGRQIFEPVYFTDVTPRTASDMLFEVPGFAVTRSGGGRGIGQGGTNVLINGQRITGKGTGPVDLLQRTPATAVERIEIVDAAALGIPGLTGQVADVYLSPSGLTGNWRYRTIFRKALEPDLGNAAVSLSGQSGPFVFTLGAENDSARRGNQGPETVTTADGSVVEERFEDGQFYTDRPSLTGALNWTRENGDIANLAVSRGWAVVSSDERRESFPVNGIPSVIDSGRKEAEHSGEVSADYAANLLGGRMKLIGLASYEHSPIDNIVVARGADGRFEGGYFDQVIDESERIGRAEFVWQALGGTMEAAAEGAFNVLRSTDEGGEIGADGIRVRTSASAVRVEEARGQASLALARPIGPFDVQLSIGAEVSEISQPGSATPSRRLLRPRGFVSAAYDWDTATDLRFRVERRVGQLNFFDFVSSVDLTDGTESCGNPAIVPQQSWFAESELVRRFGPTTQVTMSVYGETITDRVDRIALTCGADGPGNVDEASRYGGSARGTVALDALLSGLELDFDLRAQESSLEDPFTGARRAFGGD